MTDRYQIIAPIGFCGCGTIYRGWDTNQSRDVTITRIPAKGSAVPEFLQGARKLYGLRHSNIVTVYDSGADDEGGYLVTEMVKGQSLEALVAHDRLTEEQFTDLAQQVLDGLSFAHSAGLLHLNLQPGNLMLPWNAKKHFQIKLTDFNLAPSTPPQDPAQRPVHFMAPEQFGHAALDGRTDLYALGTVLYYALSQRHAFDGENVPQIIVTHLYHRVEPLGSLRPDLPASMCIWVEQLMSQNPKDRPASAADALRALKAIILKEAAVVVAPIVEEEVPVVLQVEEDIPIVLEAEEEHEDEVVLSHHEEAAPEPEFEVSESAPLNATARLHDMPTQYQEPEFEPAAIAIEEAEDAAKYAAPQRHIPRRKTSALTFILAAFGVIVVAMLGLVSYIKYSHRADREQRFAELRQSAKPEGSDLDVRILLDYLDDPATRDAAAEVLAKLRGGEYIDSLLVDHLRDFREKSVCAKLTEIIGQRKIVAAFPEVLPLVHDHRTEVHAVAWKTLAQITQPNQLKDFIEAIRHTSPRERETIQSALVTVIEKSAKRNQAIETVQQAYQSPTVDADSRTVLFNVLVHVGGPETLKLMTAAIADPTTPVRLAAITALSDYPTHEPLPAITARFLEETDAACRMYLILAATDLVEKPGPSTQEALALHAQSLYTHANTPEEKQRALVAVGRVIAPSTADFYKDYAASAEGELKDEALRLSRIFKAKLEKTITIAPSSTSTLLPAEVADYNGEAEMTREDGVLAHWNHDEDWAAWLVQIPQNGVYEITVRQAHATDDLGTYEVLLAGQTLLTAVVKTENDTDFQGFIVGQITISQPGTYRILVRPKTIPPKESLFQVKSLGIKLL